MKNSADFKYRLVYAAILTLCVAEMLWMVLPGPFYPDDSNTVGYYFTDVMCYRHAADNIVSGIVDPLRTPTYPLLILLMHSFVPETHLDAALQIFQGVFFLVSVEIFRRLCLRFMRPWPALIMIALYALLPGMLIWVKVCISDCTGIVLTVIWLWLLTRDHGARLRVSTALWSSLALILMVFLRPIFICLLPVTAVYIVNVWRRARRGAVALTAATLACVGLLMAYRAEVHRLYGLHSFTNVTSFNNLCLLGEAGLLKEEDAATPAEKEQLHRIITTGDTVTTDPLYIRFRWWYEMLPPQEFEEICTRCMRRDPAGVARALVDRFYTRTWRYPTMARVNQPPYLSLERTYIPRVSWVVLFYAASGAVLLAMTYRRRNPSQTWLLWLTGMSVIATSVIGAMADWDRLFVPAYPATLVLIGAMLSCFKFKKSTDGEDAF